MITLFFMIAASAAMQAGEIELPDHNIRVGDIANASGYEDQVIGVLPDRAAEVELDETTARQLLRNRFPSLRYVLRPAFRAKYQFFNSIDTHIIANGFSAVTLHRIKPERFDTPDLTGVRSEGGFCFKEFGCHSINH